MANRGAARSWAARNTPAGGMVAPRGDDPDQSSTCLISGRGPKPDQESVLEGTRRRCLSCGFGWTVGELAIVPDLQEDAYSGGSGHEDHSLLHRRRFEASRRLRWLLSTVRPRSLMEAGQACGFFVEAARRVGIDAFGIEASAVAARFARERLGVPGRTSPRLGDLLRVVARLPGDSGGIR